MKWPKIKIKLPKWDLRKKFGVYDAERKLREDKVLNLIGKELFRQLVKQNVKDETLQAILIADDPREKAQQIIDDFLADQSL